MKLDYNIMEQVYNYTQNEPVVHYMGIRNKAEDIKTKADQLKTTADSQSGGELTTIKSNDIQSDTAPQTLKGKAGLLKGKAQKLNEAAESLRAEAATGQLNPLQELAKSLKEAAGNQESGDDHLYGAAGQLATHSATGLEPLATNVITKFEAVKQAYGALMTEASKLTGLPQEKQQLVTAVTKEYNDLKNIYDGMLNLTKLAKAAGELSTQGGGPLATLRNAATQLEQNVTALRDNANTGNDYAKAQQVISQFETVENAYKALGDKTSVKDKFEALKSVYDQILKFTKVKHYSEQLHTAANGVNTTDVIINFNAVVDSSNALGDNKSIVKSEFDNLQKEYSKAIYVYKWYFISLPSS
uniref:Tpr-related protein family member, putative n=1 Tax=Theileria annulata TaxID=5874 RepID=A0A3B0ML77_THEAN